jgi:hypothetical protein
LSSHASTPSLVRRAPAGSARTRSRSAWAYPTGMIWQRKTLRGRLSMVDMLQQFLEFFDGQPRVLDNSRHRKSIDRIITRDNDDSVIFCHRDMFPFADDAKPCFLKGFYGSLVLNSRQFGHGYTGTSTMRVCLSLSRISMVSR